MAKSSSRARGSSPLSTTFSTTRGVRFRTERFAGGRQVQTNLTTGAQISFTIQPSAVRRSFSSEQATGRANSTNGS
jgi:hypothetical protein